MPVSFCPLASGSNGNCVFVGYSNGDTQTNLLIDAGQSGKSIETALCSIDIDPKTINGILITHEHSDHISGAGILSRRHDIPIFATERLWVYINRHNVLGSVKNHNKRKFSPNDDFPIKDVVVYPFDIPHDAIEPVGYAIYAEDKKITVATDLGHVTNKVRKALSDSDIILIESNHDVDMLKNGSYPPALKRRVMGQNGHLSNETCGELLSDIINERLKHIYLGHLSEENNRPLVAYDTVSSILSSSLTSFGYEYSLTVANRGSISEAICIS